MLHGFRIFSELFNPCSTTKKFSGFFGIRIKFSNIFTAPRALFHCSKNFPCLVDLISYLPLFFQSIRVTVHQKGSLRWNGNSTTCKTGLRIGPIVHENSVVYKVDLWHWCLGSLFPSLKNCLHHAELNFFTKSFDTRCFCNVTLSSQVPWTVTDDFKFFFEDSGLGHFLQIF